MLSATASLGLIHMWDVDGGLIPIDKLVQSPGKYQMPRINFNYLKRYFGRKRYNKTISR